MSRPSTTAATTQTTRTTTQTTTNPPPTPSAWLIRHENSEKVQDGPTSAIELLADGVHTGDALTINRARLDVGSPGAPSHLHRRATETLFVLDGSLDVLVGEKVEVLQPGDMVVLPPGTAHAFAPTTGSAADILATYTPGQRRFEYYRLLERLFRGEATVDELTATSELYDNHYVESPVWQEAHPWPW